MAVVADVLRSARLGARAPRLDWTAALTLPAMLYLAAIFVVPVTLLVVGSLSADDEFGLANYVDFLSDPHNRSIVFTTLRYGFFSAVLCLLLGYPFARLMLGVPPAVQGLLFVALILPMSLGLIVKAFGWMILLQRNGPINDALVGLGLVDRPLRLLFTELGLVIGTLGIKLPLMVLPIYVVIRSVPADLTEAARCLGAGPVYRFMHLDLPLAMPGVLTGFAFVFAQVIASYAVPTVLAGPRFLIMSREMVDSYLILQLEAKGATIAVLMLVIVIVVLAVTGALARQRAAR